MSLQDLTPEQRAHLRIVGQELVDAMTADLEQETYKLLEAGRKIVRFKRAPWWRKVLHCLGWTIS